jgi:hexosaminidase
MPGHSLAAMTAYPELCCFPGNIKVLTEGGVTTNIYCAGKEGSFTFLENVLKEIFELFPSEYIHIGGDEAHKDKWEICPLCQKRMKEEGLKDEAGLQTWFINRIEKFLSVNGKRLVGWDEILGEGLSPKAVVMAWRGVKAAKDAAKMGNDAVFAVGWPMYFSDGQNNGEDGPGVSGGNTLMKVYNCEPVPEDLTGKEKEHLLGVQACIWTERLPKFEHVEYMLFPRICALSEVAWSKAEKNWSDFYDKLEVHEKLLGKYAINYSKRRSYTLQVERSFLPERKGITLTMLPEVKTPIYYTLDGTAPDKNSNIYTEPLFIHQTCSIKACIFDDKGKTDNISTNFFRSHLAVGLKVSYGNDFSENNPTSLTDGEVNDWSQFESNDLNVLIDLGEVKQVTNISTAFKECTFKRQFFPRFADIYISKDGTNFEKINTFTNNMVPENGKNPNRNTQISVKVGKEVRYVKLFAKNPGPVQGNSKLKGQPTKILIDEIIVD